MPQKQTQVRFTEAERRMLLDLAEAHHLSMASMLRLLIVGAHNRLVVRPNRQVEVKA